LLFGFSLTGGALFLQTAMVMNRGGAWQGTTICGSLSSLLFGFCLACAYRFLVCTGVA
jgi:hypothetical protein